MLRERLAASYGVLRSYRDQARRKRLRELQSFRTANCVHPEMDRYWPTVAPYHMSWCGRCFHWIDSQGGNRNG